MRNRGATSQNSVLFSTGHFRLRDRVRLFTIQLHLLGFPHALARSPCVLSFVQNDMSADQMIEKHGRRDSQAARMLTNRS